MARPMKPLVKSGGFYPSNKMTPLVYPGGHTTQNGGNDDPEKSDLVDFGRADYMILRS